MLKVQTKERSIIMTAESVRAILDGRKTQTRRVVKPQPEATANDKWFPIQPVVFKPDLRNGLLRFLYKKCPRDSPNSSGITFCTDDTKSTIGRVGRRLWMREQWTTRKGLDGTKPRDINRSQSIGYLADDEGPWLGKIRSPIHMPRWASRLTLEVTKVKVEQVQSISKEDAIAEGLIPERGCRQCPEQDPRPMPIGSAWKAPGSNVICPDPRTAYWDMWDTINRKRDGGKYAWNKNPWVWCATFRKVEDSEER